MKRLSGPLLIGLAVALIVAAIQVHEPLRLAFMVAGMIALGFGIREVGRAARQRR